MIRRFWNRSLRCTNGSNKIRNRPGAFMCRWVCPKYISGLLNSLRFSGNIHFINNSCFALNIFFFNSHVGTGRKKNRLRTPGRVNLIFLLIQARSIWIFVSRLAYAHFALCILPCDKQTFPSVTSWFSWWTTFLFSLNCPCLRFKINSDESSL